MTTNGAARRLVCGNRVSPVVAANQGPRRGTYGPTGPPRKGGQLGSAAQTKSIGSMTSEPESRYTTTGTGITRFTVTSSDTEDASLV